MSGNGNGDLLVIDRSDAMIGDEGFDVMSEMRIVDQLDRLAWSRRRD